MASVDYPAAPSSREQSVAEAARLWQAALIDLSRRNPLLYYKDLRLSTLDLAEVTPEVVTALVKGAPCQVADLYPADEAADHDACLNRRKDAVDRLRAVYRKMSALDEERGIKAGYLALGMATWQDPGYRPAAPVLLYPVEIVPTSSRQDDFRLEIDDDPAVNPVLLEYLAAEKGIEVSADQFPIPTDANPDSLLSLVSRQLWRTADDRLPGFSIQRRQVIGTFSYAKLPMVKDLEAAPELLAGNDVVAAMAGVGAAHQSLRSGGESTTGSVSPVDEFLVLDADSSQSEAINSVAAGRNLVIKGPPGTGKSQTIVNLVATLIAQGKRVLFVAEKRAAIDVVMRRLSEVGLADLVMDAHDGAKARSRIVEGLKSTLELAGNIGKPRIGKLHDRLTAARDTLEGYRDFMFTTRQPWELSVFDAQCVLLDAGSDADSAVTLTDDTLSRLTPATADLVREWLSEYADLGGFTLESSDTLWYGARFDAATDVADVLSVVDGLVAVLPELGEAVARISALTRTRLAETVSEFAEQLDLLTDIDQTARSFDRLVWTAPLPEWIAATGSRRWRAEHGVRLSWLRRRRMRRRAKAITVARLNRSAIHQGLTRAAEQRDRWMRLSHDGAVPFAPPDTAATQELLKRVEQDLARLVKLFPESEPASMSLTDMTVWLKQLAADRVTPPLIARLRELRAELIAVGLGPLLTQAHDRGLDRRDALAMFERSFAASLIALLARTDKRFHRFKGEVLTSTQRDFVEADAEHLAANPERVRRAVAERLYATRDEHLLQETFLKKQLYRKRRQASLRTLFEQAEDIVTALTPCVAMSPLVVSQQLPARRLFDVVIFDEASQVPIADAIPAIMRAEQVVMTGDPEQLPPSRFFTASEDDTTEEDDPAVAAGLESILESMDVLLESRSLTWHYRSRDERLIDFANRHVYDNALVTFAGRTDSGGVTHVHCPDGDPTVRPGSAEVDKVVELVLKHARDSPRRSLGVIAMSIKHARRIEAALDRARIDHPDLDDFFSTDRDEPFFIKNLERVQGDERDAIIMSLGYRHGRNGTMHHHFGPLNQDGGHRRLNVAITRAKQQMTTVSGFTAAELDPEKLTASGARLLRDYLAYAAAGGSPPVADLDSAAPLNAFERDVRHRLASAEIPTVARYGASTHRIDLAVPHPRDPAQMVLAIEVDGLGSADTLSTRDRDRLRQQVLSSMGWSVHRIWSCEWFADPVAEVLKTRKAYNAAVNAADRQRLLPPGPEPVSPKVAAPKQHKRQACPIKTGKKSIRSYSHSQLVSLIEWIRSDNRLRTEDELLREAIRVLGFSRKGPRIVEALTKAIAAAG